MATLRIAAMACRCRKMMKGHLNSKVETIFELGYVSYFARPFPVALARGDTRRKTQLASDPSRFSS